MKLEHTQPIQDWWKNRMEIINEETGEEKSRCFSAQQLLDLGLNFDQCKFPKEEEDVLRPKELLKRYYELKVKLIDEIENVIQNCESIIDNKKPTEIQLTIKKPCAVLAELINNIPERLKKSILREAIEGRLVPQDSNDEPASVLLAKIRKEKEKLVKEGKLKKKDLEVKPITEDEIPFEIPESWKWCRVGDVFLHASGKQQSSNNKNIGTLKKYITTSNLYWGQFVLDTLKEMYFTDEELKTCSAQKGDLLVCEGGAGYGRSAIWPYEYEICLQNHVHRLRPVIDGVCEYVYYLIYFLKESNQLASVGTAMPGLSANRLKELLVPFPPLAEQRRIVEKLKQLLGEVDKLKIK